MTILTTARLRLEPFGDHHLEGLHAMNRLPEVMRFITGKPETLEQTRAAIELVKGRWGRYGFSWWAFVERDTERVIGAGCIQYLGRDPANPHEIGWRLVPDKWGQGYASEAARAMAAFAFDTLDAPLLCAVCKAGNLDSAKVMLRLGMRYRGEESWYDSPHAVYEMTRAEWQAMPPASGAPRPAPAAPRG